MDADIVVSTLLKNRGLTSSSDIFEFFTPPHPDSISSPFDSDSAVQLIKQHINRKNKIYIYGDYDVDGICATAIIWETLHSLHDYVMPFIPHRRTDGYGLTQKGIDHCLEQGSKLIIVVDSGIVAHAAIEYCRKAGCDIIIIDHHEPSEVRPVPNVLLHSSVTSAAGLAWFLCREIARTYNLQPNTYNHLELVALSVICDLVPLLGVNRSFAKYGLQELNHTRRPGLLALFNESGIAPATNNLQLTTYHIGFVIGPRLNASGRLDHALDSLRLLCTKNPSQASSLAQKLEATNKSRQDITLSAVTHATNSLTSNTQNPLLVVADPSYDEGIIGLVAAKLTEKFYRPSLAISIGPEISKGSARSVSGFHITDHLRSFSHLLDSVGGHAMAAGFSLKTTLLEDFVSQVQAIQINSDLLLKKQRVDAEIPLDLVSEELYLNLQKFEPFGLGNPTPIFLSNDVPVSNIKKIGSNFQHLKLKAGGLDAIWFNSTYNLLPATYNPIYQIGKNTWNGKTSLQLEIKNLTPTQ